MSKIDNDFYSAELKEGEWIVKSKIPSLKSDGRYKDAPRYPMIYEYEGEFKRDYNKLITNMVKDIGKKLLTFEKNKTKK